MAIGLLTIILGLQTTTPEREQEETLVDMDLKDAKADAILGLLAEVGGFNLVVDPAIKCRLTLNLKMVRWQEVYDTVLRSCRLGEDRVGRNLVRVAPIEELAAELAERRKYEDEKKTSGELRTTYRRLAYARAKEMAPLLERFLSPRGEVSFDERTNTLIITDVVR